MQRREFLASSATAACVTLGNRNSMASETTPTQTNRPRFKADVPTPALILDLDAFESNLKTMAEHCRRAGVNYRPHAKTHKCPEIARRQIASGAIGICAATVPEVEALAAGGIRGILLTSPIMEPAKIHRVVDLIKRGHSIMLAVGHARQAHLLAEAADAAKVNLDVLVDVDVGDRRTGILPGQPALELAREIERSKLLRVRGVPVEEITALSALVLLPWMLKFAWAPLVDVLRTPRWTTRSWIVSAQSLMAVSLLPLEKLIEMKLASGLSAAHRLKDLADVLELIRALSLPRETAASLDPSVRAKFDELWQAAQAAERPR